MHYATINVSRFNDGVIRSDVRRCDVRRLYLSDRAMSDR